MFKCVQTVRFLLYADECTGVVGPDVLNGGHNQYIFLNMCMPGRIANMHEWRRIHWSESTHYKKLLIVIICWLRLKLP